MALTKIHLDTDIGGDMDDLCALAMLLKWPDLEIIVASLSRDIIRANRDDGPSNEQ